MALMWRQLQALLPLPKPRQLTIDSEAYEADLSVAVQQAFSYLYQYRAGVNEVDFISLLSELCDEQISQSILQHLSQKDWIQRVGEQWYPATLLLDLAQRGRIHSNISSSGTCKVVDVSTGKEIGTVSGMHNEIFLLAGQFYRLTMALLELVGFTGT